MPHSLDLEGSTFHGILSEVIHHLVQEGWSSVDQVSLPTVCHVTMIQSLIQEMRNNSPCTNIYIMRELMCKVEMNFLLSILPFFGKVIAYIVVNLFTKQ